MSNPQPKLPDNNLDLEMFLSPYTSILICHYIPVNSSNSTFWPALVNILRSYSSDTVLFEDVAQCQFLVLSRVQT